jgi:predicted metal-dependent hydrolase
MSSGRQVGTIRIDKIIHSRRRTISLEIKPDGSLLVRAPLLATNGQIDKLVRQKEDWILEKKALVHQRSLENPARKFAAGEEFPYLGKSYPLEIVNKQDQALILRDKFYLAEFASVNAKADFIDWYKAQAALEIRDRVEIYAQLNGYAFKRFRITIANTRWGSCGPHGSLNFSYRLVMAPIEIIDYVVVHELVHLRIKNHSKTFWGEVQKLMPDYDVRRRWLKENGHRLTLN